jgi:hypothetical protein
MTLELATTFATIVQLVGMFIQERRGESATAIDFLTYLERHNHADLKAALEGNRALLAGIEEILANGRAELLAKVDEVSVLSVQILSTLQSLSAAAASMALETGLSKEAETFLREGRDARWRKCGSWLVMV